MPSQKKNASKRGPKPKQIFLSWSGKLSQDIAELLHQEIPEILKKTNVFFSKKDIRKGANGVEELLQNLKKSEVAISILTKANKTRPWIMFEAGAIRGHGGTCYNLLVDIPNAKVVPPLSNFQNTQLLDKADFRRLLHEISKVTQKTVSPSTITRSIGKRWPKIEASIQGIIKKNQKPAKLTKPSKQQSPAKEDAKPEASSKQNRKGLLPLSDEVKKYLD